MTAPRNTSTKSVDRTWKTIVVAADPDFEAQKRREVEYEFKGRTFSANRAQRHPYDRDEE